MNMENMALRLYDLDFLSFTIQPSSPGFTAKITSLNQFCFLYKENGQLLAEYSNAGNESYSEFYAS